MPQRFPDSVFEPVDSFDAVLAIPQVDSQLTDPRVELPLTGSFDEDMYRIQRSLEESEARLSHFNNLLKEKREKIRHRQQRPVGKKQ